MHFESAIFKTLDKRLVKLVKNYSKISLKLQCLVQITKKDLTMFFFFTTKIKNFISSCKTEKKKNNSITEPVLFTSVEEIVLYFASP